MMPVRKSSAWAVFLASALAILLATPAHPQAGRLPKLSELWRVTLTYHGASWIHVGDTPDGKSHWLLEFTVSPKGPRPVWTALPSPPYYDYVDVDEYNTSTVALEQDPRAIAYTTPSGAIKWLKFPRKTEEPYAFESNLATHNGVVLEPGRYRLSFAFFGLRGGNRWVVTDPAKEVRNLDLKLTIMIGYWAEP